MMKKINDSLDENALEKLKKRFNASSDDEAVRSAISHILNKKAYFELLEFEGNMALRHLLWKQKHRAL